MQIFLYIADFIVPFIILAVVIYGLLSKIHVYDTFIKGARSGFLTVVRLMPTLIGLMAAVGVRVPPGFLDFLGQLLGQFTAGIGFPGELVPLSIVKMFSSSAATRAFAGRFQRIWDRFPHRTHRLDFHVLHRDDFLYHERLLYDRAYPKIPLYPHRRHDCHLCRTRRKCCAGRYDAVIFLPAYALSAAPCYSCQDCLEQKVVLKLY